MEMHRQSMRAFTATAVILLAACDSTATPIVAAVGGTHASVRGRQLLVLSPGALTLAVGSTFQLNTNAPTTLRNMLQWSSGNSAVASVSPSGAVFGAGVGSATISVRYSDDTTNVGTATITVTGAANTADRAPAGR
jgi:Big-like domain-containing protein